MAQQVIYVGSAPNDGLGDPIRTAYQKCNTNFSELYSRVQTDPPTTLIGTVGDQAGMYAFNSNYFYYCFANYDGSSTIWAELSSIGNISATQLVNGTSSVKIPDINGNANISIGGTSNVVVFKSTGVNVTGTTSISGNVTGGNIRTVGVVSATGNITGNYILGNGSQLTGLPATYANANVAAYLPTYSGNISSNNITASNTISSTGNITTAGNVNATGDVKTQGIVSATGNIVTSGYFVGNFAGNIVGNLVVPGSNTQVLFNTNGNADAVGGFTFNTNGPNLLTVLGTISSQGNVIAGNVKTVGLVSATGNVSGNYILGNGALLTGVITSVANINSGTSNVTVVSSGGNVTVGVGGTPNVAVFSTSGEYVSGVVSASGNITAGNVNTGGQISATGNISTAGKLYATGNIDAGGNVSATNYTGVLISASGNITGDNLLTGGIVSATGNVTGGNIRTAGLISATGNVTGGNINGTIYGNVTATTVSATANVTAGNVLTGGIVSATGNITGGNLTLSITNGDITGHDLSVGGNISAGFGYISALGNVTGGNILTAGIMSSTGNATAGNILTGGIMSSTGNATHGNLSVSTGTVTLGSIVNANANGVGNIGSSGTTFNTVFAKATSAQYADLAEKYVADAEYAPGTVLSIGGTAEVTQSSQDQDTAVAGVVSTKPAYQMNSALEGTHVAVIALVGRVPCLVQGPVARGAMLVSAGNGRARAEPNPRVGTVVGRALESFDGDTGTIEVLVGKL